MREKYIRKEEGEREKYVAHFLRNNFFILKRFQQFHHATWGKKS